MKIIENKPASKNAFIHGDFFVQQNRKIILREKSVNHFIKMENITHMECDCYLTTVFTLSGKSYIVAKLLKEFEVELVEFGFIRVNRNALINICHMQSYEKGRRRTVHLSPNTAIVVSRRGMARLKEAIEGKCR